MKRSERFQTSSTFRREPRKTKATTIDGERKHSLGAPEVFHVLAGEEVPADDRGEGEKQEADCHKFGAEAFKSGGESGLPATGVPVVPASIISSRTPEERITRAVMVSTTKVSTKTPIIATSPCSSGSFTSAMAWACGVEPIPASLEKRPRASTITHSHTDRHTGCGTCQCPGTERSHKNGGNRRRKIADIHDQYDQCSAKIQSCHDRNHFFCKGSDTGNTAKENEGCQQSHYQSHRPSGDRKSRIEGIADRVGLYHISHEAKSKNDCHCKENSQETTKTAFKHMCDIIDRSAHYFSILISLFGFLGENSFSVDRRHSEESCAATSRRLLPDRRTPVLSHQPAIFPVPTWAAIAVARAWKELIPSFPAFFPFKEKPPNTRIQAVLKRRT